MTETTDVQVVEPSAKPVTIEEIKQRANMVQQCVKDIMKTGIHYGVIPGCGNKFALLKPGAEKLMFLFGMAARIDETSLSTRDLGNGHREYTMRIPFFQIESGRFLGTGMGSCSTLEGKYRYRSEQVSDEVPQEYWKNRDASLLGGPNRSVRKKDKQWVVVDRIEHDNPADYYNTCLKMAKKRALIDGVLNITGASDMFEPDDAGDDPTPPNPRTNPRQGNKNQAKQQAQPKAAEPPKEKPYDVSWLDDASENSLGARFIKATQSTRSDVEMTVSALIGREFQFKDFMDFFRYVRSWAAKKKIQPVVSSIEYLESEAGLLDFQRKFVDFIAESPSV